MCYFRCLLDFGASHIDCSGLLCFRYGFSCDCIAVVCTRSCYFLEEQALEFWSLSRIASTLSLGLLAAKWILAGEQAGYPLVACFCMVSANTELLATAGLVAHLRSLLVKVAIQRQAAVGQTAGCGWNPKCKCF